MASTTATHNSTTILDQIGQETLLELYRRMLLIRRFEERSMAAYQQKKKKIAGFYILTLALRQLLLVLCHISISH